MGNNQQKSEIRIVQRMEIRGWRLTPVTVEVTNPPRWFFNGEFDGVTLTKRPPRRQWWYVHWMLFRSKVFGDKRSGEYVIRYVDAVNKGFDDAMRKYQDYPMDYIEMHLLRLKGR